MPLRRYSGLSGRLRSARGASDVDPQPEDPHRHRAANPRISHPGPEQGAAPPDQAAGRATGAGGGPPAADMNGAVYISFFQGQLESVLEQVVQLAVQEISSSVGSSLNALLLETAAKEQENRRLRLQLQASAEDQKNKAGEERGAGGGRKPEPPPGPRPPGQPSPGPGARATPDTRRLEQRGRVVDQLKCVMEQVLDFALRELTKIVEASFDDLLLEITKMDREQALLQDRLGRGGGDRPRGGGARTRAPAPPGRRRGSENDSVSPSGSDEAREEQAEGVRRTAPPSDPARPPVVSVSQDWVPILDKVFGQKWCGEAWQSRERGRGPEEGAEPEGEPPPSRPVLLQPAPSSPQQDPRWTPLEDMEVFSPDEEEAAEGQRSSGPPPDPPGPPPDPPAAPPSPTGRSPPASMLHRLLTLPSQLLDDDADEEAAARETLVALATNGGGGEERDGGELPEGPSREEEEEDEEEGEEEEDKGRKKKRRRVWSECEDCGRRFSRASLLKTHRQTHLRDAAPPDSGPLSGDSAPPLCCPHCGRRFSSSARLHSHVRTQHPEGRS